MVFDLFCFVLSCSVFCVLFLSLVVFAGYGDRLELHHEHERGRYHLHQTQGLGGNLCTYILPTYGAHTYNHIHSDNGPC